jgi:anion-transporting  ArsA/GET3 family ATPase
VEERLKDLELRKNQGEKILDREGTLVEDELKRAQEERDSEAQEVDNLARSRKFNADEACKVAQEKSVVGSVNSSSTKEEWEELPYEQFVEKYQQLMDEYIGKRRSLDDAEAFLSDHPMLVTEHALGYMLMQALQHGMREERQAMRRVVANKYHVKSLIDYGQTTNKRPQALIEYFFDKLRKSNEATQEYWRGYEDLFKKLEVR